MTYQWTPPPGIHTNVQALPLESVMVCELRCDGDFFFLRSTECGKSNTVLYMRLDHKNPCSFQLVFFECLCWKKLCQETTMLLREPMPAKEAMWGDRDARPASSCSRTLRVLDMRMEMPLEHPVSQAWDESSPRAGWRQPHEKMPSETEPWRLVINSVLSH